MIWALNCKRCGIPKTKVNTYFNERTGRFSCWCRNCQRETRAKKREKQWEKQGIKVKRRRKKERVASHRLSSFEDVKKIADKLYREKALTERLR